MSRWTLSRIIGAGIAALALVLLLTTVPLVPQSRVKDGSATAVAIVDPIGPDPEQDCIDVAFTATISYTTRRPAIDLFGFARAQAIVVDPARLEVSARPECADDIDSVGGTVYLNSPICESGLCEGANLDYGTGEVDSGTTSTTNYDGDRQLPDSPVVRDEWCLEFAASVAFGRVNGGGDSDAARVTDSDLCLDLS